MKIAQAVMTAMADGKRMKLVIMSDKCVEVEFIGAPDDCLRELKHYAKTREWHRRSIY